MKKYLNKGVLLILSLVILVLQTGCWDYTELDDNAFVVVIGFDKLDGEMANEKEKKRNAMKVTYLIANPQVGTSALADVSQDEKANETATFIAPDFISSRDLANVFVSRRISFSHLRMIVIGEEYAKDPKTVNQLLQLTREQKVRENSVLMVSKEPAFEFLKNNKPIFDTRIHRYVQATTTVTKKTGLTPYSTYKDFVQKVSEPYSSQIVMYGTNEVKEKDKDIGAKNIAGDLAKIDGDSSELLGAAVFHKGTMVGTISGNDVRLVLLVSKQGLLESIERSFHDPLDPEHFVSLELSKHQKKPLDIEVDVDGEYPKIQVTVPLKMQLLSSPGKIDYIEKEEYQKKLGEHIANQLQSEMNTLIQKAQESYGDIFDFHQVARTKFLTYKDWVAYDWEEKFKKADIEVKFDCSCRNFGDILAPIKKEG